MFVHYVVKLDVFIKRKTKIKVLTHVLIVEKFLKNMLFTVEVITVLLF